MSIHQGAVKLQKAIVASLVGLAVACACAAVTAPDAAYAVKVRQADVAVASEGNVLLGIDGTFTSDGKAAVLKRVNQIRKEACDEGVPDPRDSSRSLSPADYVPIKWSSDLELIAQTRAAEGAINQDHIRPNGDYCFAAHSDLAITSSAEDLAWNYSGMLDGIEQWYGEKTDWVRGRANAVTGHYTSLINPYYAYIGLGTFAPNQGGWACTAGELSPDVGSWSSSDYGIEVSEDEIGVTGSYRQIVEVPASKVAGLSIKGNAKFKGQATRAYKLVANVELGNAYGKDRNVEMALLDAVTWNSSNQSVVTVNATGTVTSKACGKATISAESIGRTASLKVTVNPKGTSLKKPTAKKRALKVSWAKQAGFAQGYQVRYSTKSSMKGAKKVTVKGAGKKSTTLKKLSPKKKYYVQVRTFAKVNGKYYYSDWSSKKSAKTK